LEEGSYWDDELGAEYLGGVLASSRTEAPRDDRSASLIALVSRLSTYALRVHYLMYAGARPTMAGSGCNIGDGSKRHSDARFFMPFETYILGMEFAEEQDQRGEILPHSIHALL